MRTRKVTTAAGTTMSVPSSFLVIALMEKMGGWPGLFSHLVCFHCGDERWDVRG